MKPKVTLSKMTAAQKRVAIAKDVLEQIATRRIHILQSCFFKDTSRGGSMPIVCDQKTLTQPHIPCGVCAIGAGIVSGIRLFNKFSIRQDEETEELLVTASAFFGKHQSYLIENAFEVGHGAFSKWDLTERESEGIKKAIAFGKKFRYPKSRAVAIFKNIIRNKGTFIP